MSEPLRVLLIDDDPDDRLLALRELRKEFPDIEAIEIKEGRELEQALERGGFDLAITDYLLRWTDGIRVLTALKARHPDCPVIMFTGTGSEEIAVEAMKNGLDDYAIKNVHHLVRLRAAVHSLLERAQSKQRAAQLATRLETLLSRLNLGTFRCTAGGELLEANPALVQMLALPSEEEAEGTVLQERFLQPDDCVQLFDRLVRTGQPQERELEWRGPAGHTRWLRLFAVVGASPKDNAVIDGFVEDVTERRRMADELQKQQLALNHVSRITTIGEMAAGITHELTQPVYAISNVALGLTRALERSKNSESETVSSGVRQILEQATRAGELIKRWRDFTRRRQADRSTWHLNALVQEAVELTTFESREHGVELALQLAEPSPLIAADRIQIQQVVVNLLRNAYEATYDQPESDRRVTIQTTAGRDHAEVAIRDTGSGVPEERLEQIFEPFYTTKPDGMGMGLAVSRSIVEAHHGRLWATRDADEGMTFRLTLPITQDDETSAE